MKTPDEVLQKLIQLKTENLDLQVIICIDNEETLDPDEHKYVCHEFHDVELDYVWKEDDESWFGKDNILVEMDERIEMDPESYPDRTADEWFESEAEQVICVYTRPV